MTAHCGHIGTWPPYVGGDDDGIQAFYGECCVCGWKGEHRFHAIPAYGDLVRHLNEGYRTESAPSSSSTCQSLYRA